MFMCPVCYYPNMPYAAHDYNICPCCGTEFENDDEDCTHKELRDAWVSRGARWFFRQAPNMWNPWVQLSRAGVELPYRVSVSSSGSPTVESVSPPDEKIDRLLGMAA